MKILCPIDFSEESVNACNWIVENMTDIAETEICFLHCVNIQRRASLFTKIDHYFKQKAEEDMEMLMNNMRDLSANLIFRGKVLVTDPKSYIPKYAQKENFDLIVMGSKGLTALNELFIGSVTAQIINKSTVPTLTIPFQAVYKGLKKIVLAVDEQSIKSDSAFQFLSNLCNIFSAKLHIIHVQEEAAKAFVFDSNIEENLKNVPIEKTILAYQYSIVDTINDFCKTNDANVLCMIHRNYNWFEKLFHHSITKSGLYELNYPLLVLSEQ